ncbi:hypothetical protein CC86DRAFT_400965 [Ophiobolus disseminans]|uniref:Uncharacterized protein n=1 Tax=Ophiobolus disseminans TaxID=1469910 RepID=A0A6A7AGD9_9PLEO|nr:hypothetical protein CC86DRAFT_400965 [Ophiobolus disseminans]
MDLPQELHDLVYHHLWQYSNLVFAVPNPAPTDKCRSHLQAFYGTKPAQKELYTGLPMWLLANKSILHQGLATFVANATLSVNHSAAKTVPLVDMYQTKRFCLQFADQHVGPILAIDMESYIAVPQHIPSFPNLTSLGFVITFSVPSGFEQYYSAKDDEPWEVSVPGFKVKGTLVRKLEVRLELSGYREYMHKRRAEEIREAFEKEVERTGAETLGKGGWFKTVRSEAVWKGGGKSTQDVLEPYVFVATYVKGEGGGRV